MRFAIKPKKPNISDAERNEFRDAMTHFKAAPNNDEQNDTRIAIEFNPHWSDPGMQHLVYAETQLHYIRDKSLTPVLSKLQAEKFPITARTDLHGQRIEGAREHLIEFLRSCFAEKHRTVLIIHGKGRTGENGSSIIKTHVNHWLRQVDRVLCFSSCAPHQGGTGAILVYLKVGTAQ